MEIEFHVSILHSPNRCESETSDWFALPGPPERLLQQACCYPRLPASQESAGTYVLESGHGIVFNHTKTDTRSFLLQNKTIHICYIVMLRALTTGRSCLVPRLGQHPGHILTSSLNGLGTRIRACFSPSASPPEGVMICLQERLGTLKPSVEES